MNQPRNLQQEIDFLKGRLDLLEVFLVVHMTRGFSTEKLQHFVKTIEAYNVIDALSVIDEELNLASTGRSDSYRSGVDNQKLKIRKIAEGLEQIIKSREIS